MQEEKEEHWNYLLYLIYKTPPLKKAIQFMINMDWLRYFIRFILDNG